jgi:hypothetical protein
MIEKPDHECDPEMVELGRRCVAEIVGGEPTIENVRLWYARERQKQRAQIRLVSDNTERD